MKRKKRSQAKIEAEIDGLELLSHAELKARWNELYDVRCPKHMSRKFCLARWHVEFRRMRSEAREGDDAAKRISIDVSAGKPVGQLGLTIKPGTRLVRDGTASSTRSSCWKRPFSTKERPGRLSRRSLAKSLVRAGRALGSSDSGGQLWLEAVEPKMLRGLHAQVLQGGPRPGLQLTGCPAGRASLHPEPDE